MYVQTETSEGLLAAVHKSPRRARSDADVTDTLNFRTVFLLAGGLNAKSPVWNSQD
jgi:hypothetical protein